MKSNQIRAPMSRSFRGLFHSFLFLLAASLLFYLSFPSNIFRFGLGFFSFFSILPVYILIHRNSLKSMPAWGFLYGMFTYMLFNSWLLKFDPKAFVVVPVIYGTYFLLFFPAMKIIMLAFPRWSMLLLGLSWVAYEYLRTLGFLGYSFGVLGYALSFYSPLIQITELVGVWGLCFLAVFPSCLLYKLITSRIYSFKNFCRNTELLYCSVAYALLLLVVFCYGYLRKVDYSESPTKKIALIQHVMDPWKGGTPTYKKSLETLTRLSDEVIKEENLHMLVWSETAFVPSISYHLRYRENNDYVRLINELLRYFEKHPDMYFLIGNGEGKREFDENNVPYRDNYNATILYKGRERVAAYYKLHLVPFTEHFPYKKSLAFIYNALKKLDVHFWKQGTEHVVFNTSEVKFSTPICFEDGFGEQNARFVQEGAELLINVTNDAWSQLEVNAMQHLQLSLLRAVENRRTVLRATNSGMTAVIDPNGEILSMLPSFQPDYLIMDVPVFTSKQSIYTQYPDWLALACAVLAFLCVFYAIVKLGTRSRKII